MSKLSKAIEKSKRQRDVGSTGSRWVEPPRGGIDAPATPSGSTEPTPAPRSQVAEQPPAPMAEVASGSASPDPHLVSLLKPQSFEAERFQRLRYVIEQLSATEGLKAVAVTSPEVSDGKTLTAINLAGSLAQNTQNRVLLIDADLRRPAVHSRLRVRGGPKGGLARLRSAPDLTLASATVRLAAFNLDVLPAGARLNDPYEVLTSSIFHELLDQARQSYDYIVLDTPPVLACQDCRLLESRVDGYLLVVSADKTPRDATERALEELPDKVLGIVFNRYDESQRAYTTYYR